jgi:hypothetical protein
MKKKSRIQNKLNTIQNMTWKTFEYLHSPFISYQLYCQNILYSNLKSSLSSSTND